MSTSDDSALTTPDPGRTVPSVAKAVRIMETLAASREPLGLADLARRLGLPKSTAKTLCATLVQTRMAVRNSWGAYSLGPHVVDLSRAYLARVDVAADFADVCAVVPELNAYTLALSVLDGRDVVYMARRPGTEPFTPSYPIGLRVPACCAAGGKALLSQLPAAELDRLFPGPELPTLTEHSLTSVEALRGDLAAVRQRGYALDDEESTPGIYSIGAATLTPDGEATAAAVSLSVVNGLSDQVAPEHLVTLARALSEHIGAPASPRGVAGQVRTWGTTAARSGDLVPDVDLTSTSGRLINLRRLADSHHVVLFFYPGDLEGLRYPELAGCTTQARAFRDAIGSVAARGAEIFGVSLQSTPRQREFVTRESLPFELLSDERRELARALGVPLWLSRTGEEFASRTTLVVRRGGEIASVTDSLPAQEQVDGVLAALSLLAVPTASWRQPRSAPAS